jgi:hypothetical protein
VTPFPEGVFHSQSEKFDFQLSEAIINERGLAEIFSAKRIEKIELKSESVQWEETRNICIEYARDGKPTGISVTEADYWVHELKRDGQTLVYLMFPIERLKELCRDAKARGWFRHGAGDGGRQSVILLRLWDILR